MPPWIALLWDCLLRSYPSDFRLEYGPEMTQTFSERYREEGSAARFFLCMRTFTDVLATAAKEHHRVMMNDLRQSYRRLAATPVITAVAIFSLALGIGANSAIFSLVYAVLLRPLPYPEVDRRVILFTGPPNSGARGNATTADFIDWRRASTTLDDWNMFSFRSVVTALGAGLPERIKLQHVTPGLFQSLGVRPVIGRLFRTGEEKEHPALISEGYWRRRFEASPDVLGRSLRFGDGVHTVIGVIPSGFELFDEPSGIDVWNTIDLHPGSIWVQRKVPWLMATAKLKPGIALPQAQQELSGIAAELARIHPLSNANRAVMLTPMGEVRSGNAGPLFYPLVGTVAFVLLIACVNVANLLLARAVVRRREIAVRAALGASRRRLVRELLADGVALAIPAMAAGLALGFIGLELLRAYAPAGFPGIARVEINRAVLGFTAAVGVFAGLVAAVLPAVEASRADLTEALKEGARGSASRRRQRLRTCLVGGEIALALVLLNGAGLLIGTVVRLQNFDPGFDGHNVTVAQFHLTGPRYVTNAPSREIDMRKVEPAVQMFFEHVLAGLRSLPAVEGAAFTASVPLGPLSGPADVRIRPAGASEADGELAPSKYTPVTADYFEAMRIPLRKGRYIDEHDTASAQWVAVVNEAFARQFFPNSEALGQVVTVTPAGGAAGELPRQIVGVVADHTQYTPRIPPVPEIYTSYFQQPNLIPGTMQGQRFRPSLVVRTRGAAAIAPETIATIVAGFDRELAVADVKPLEHYIRLRNAPMRFYAHTLGLFAVIAIVLAAIGIYGLMSYSVADRLHEIGIRLSVGASPSSVLWMIVSHGLKIAAIGIVIGFGISLMTTRLLQGFLFGLEPWDPLTFSCVAMLVLIVALTATAWPALRATRVNPVLALRHE